MQRTTHLRIRVSPSEAVWFKQAAREKGTTLSELIRLSLAAEAAKAGTPVPAPMPAT